MDTPESETTIRLGDQLSFALYAANNAFGRAYKAVLEPLGLTYSQYLVMLCLWEQDRQTIGAIGGRVFLETNTLTPLLKRLEASGLVHRERDKADERQVHISLSEKGRALQARALDVPRQIGSFSDLDADQEVSLRDWLQWLRGSLEANMKAAAERRNG